METARIRRRRAANRLTKQVAFALGAYVIALGLPMPARAQNFDSPPTNGSAHQHSPRRARTIRADRPVLAPKPEHDYAGNIDASSLTDGRDDIPYLEMRIRDLTAKVNELNGLLQRQKEAAAPVQFVPKPQRVTLLEQHRSPRVPKTYGEALEVTIRERVRSLRTAFADAEKRPRLAFDAHPGEVQRLLEPIEQWLTVRGTREQMMQAHLEAIIYATLLEARANIDGPEPLPAVHKLLCDFRVDRGSLTEHLRRSFLLDNPTVTRDLRATLAATAATYPEPPGMRDFLIWIARGVGTDLNEDAQRQAAYLYRGDPEGQFDAAAENATNDNGDVLKLQVELQRMLVEAQGLRAMNRVDDASASAWDLRLLNAERALDRLLRSADSEREAVMTLARRVPAPHHTPPSTPPNETLVREAPERVATDGLTTQY